MATNTNNYENIDYNKFTIDNIATDGKKSDGSDKPIRFGYDYTLKNVFDGLNKIIKAIIDKFTAEKQRVNNDFQGVLGTFILPEHPNNTDSYTITKQYKIDGLNRKYTRGYFGFFDSNGDRTIDYPTLWVANMGKVYFLNHQGNMGNLQCTSTPWFDYYGQLKLTKFVVSQTDTSIIIDITIEGSNIKFTGNELRYALY